MSKTEWTLTSLNKAYQQGYMTGLAGKESTECPYQNDVLLTAWEVGWDDGYGQYRHAQRTKNSSRRA